ncbi:uncharacterized protein L3040_000049 [Drepanopeziza brunnea f. sp. 'multigermtubi']|nr:hypothetical protein L3040_000049 [Drepanopeziza brunnea f. sp. 'multigermtubi']
MKKFFKDKMLGTVERDKNNRRASAVPLTTPSQPPPVDIRLANMAVRLNVMGDDRDGTGMILLYEFLIPMKDPAHPSSYSFDLFVARFERKLGEIMKKPGYETEISHGKLGYFTAKKDYEKVWDQESFEVAVNHMYIHRGASEEMSFMYQPEYPAQREERLATGAVQAGFKLPGISSGRAAATGPAAEYFKLPTLPGKALLAGSTTVRSSSLPVAGLGSAEGSYKPEKLNGTMAVGAATDVEKDIEFARLEELEKNDTVASSPVSPFTIRPPRKSSLPAQDSSAAEENSAVVKIPTNSSSGRLSRSSGSIKSAVKKVVGIVARKEPETREEMQRRFKTLYTEVGKTSYTRGGDEGALSPEDVQKFEKADHTVVEGEAEAEPEKTEDEDDEDDDISNEDRIVTRLQELQNIGELGQLRDPKDTAGTLTRWTECCAMFRIDPSETKMGEVVRIVGLKTPLYQYQAFGVYWQMVTSRDVGGGFVADDMGLGKTMSFLAYVVVERQLAVLWRDVLKSRVAKDGRHLLSGESGSCPTSPKRGWITCPCSSSSPTSKLNLKVGLRMACVPQALVGQWWAQWKTHVDTSDNVLGMKIVVDHPALCNDFKTLAEDRVNSCEQSQARGRMEATKAIKNAKKNDVSKEHQEGILFLTTKENYPKSMKAYFESPGFVHDPKVEGGWKTGTRCSLIFGIAMIDESHEEYFKNKGRAGILANLPRQNNAVRPFVWGYSGTPISQTPRGIEGVLWAIEKHSKTVNPAFEWKKLDEICKAYDHQLKSHTRDDAAVAQILADFKPFLERLMLRRTAETRWFGHTIMKLPPHIHADVRLGPNETFTHLIPSLEMSFDHERAELLESLQARWEGFPDLRRSNIKPTRLAFNTETRTLWRSRILATFPYLYKLMTGTEDRLDLSVKELQAFQARKESNPYRKYIKQIVEGSPKCLWLYDFMTKLSQQVDVNNNPHKLVIMTSFPQVAYILKLFIAKYFPEYKDLVGVLAGRMKGSEKSEILRAFTDANSKSRGTAKPSRSVQILVGLTQVVGVGLQLQKACHVVLMEPDYDFVRELQAYARVHRIGQKNPLSRSFRLITDDDASPVERAILLRQLARNELVGREVRAEEVARIEEYSTRGARLDEEGVVAGAPVPTLAPA